MKAIVEMVIEFNDEAQDFEIESCIPDALTEFAGNCVEFYHAEITDLKLGLKKFTQDIRAVVALETFEASFNNYIAGKTVRESRTFLKGVIYIAGAWRSEGMHIDGFFVFHKNAGKFAQTR